MNSDPEPKIEDDSHDGPHLYAGLLAAQMAIDTVAPDAKTTGGAIYRYTSSEAVIRDGRKAFHEGGLVLIRGRVKKHPGDGNGEFLVVTYFRLAHVSGEYLDFSIGIPAVPNRGMGNDKATGSAITYATRYAIIGMLCLPRVEKGMDPEEHPDDERPSPRYEQRQTQQRPQATATSQGSQASRGAVDAASMAARIKAMWPLIERLGDQPTYADLDGLVASNSVERLRNIGMGSLGELKAAILRVEDALTKRGVPPVRPSNIQGRDFTQASSEKLAGYAKSLADAADIALHKDPNTA